MATRTTFATWHSSNPTITRGGGETTETVTALASPSGTGPLGQSGVPVTSSVQRGHEREFLGQAPVPGGLIGSAGVEPSGTVFKPYVPTHPKPPPLQPVTARRPS